MQFETKPASHITLIKSIPFHILVALAVGFNQASPGKKTTQAIKSPCSFGCVGYLALAELLISFYI